MPSKMGRPKVDNPKVIRYSICLDTQTERQLQAYCAERGITRGEAVRRAIELLLRAEKK